jgi:serine/threonine protein phosphatase PrpC
LCPNYVPANSKTKVTKIKRAHQEEINNNTKNINQNCYSLEINSYEPVNNSQNMIFDLNIKPPNLNVGNNKIKVKKLPNKKIEERVNINYTFNNSLNPINSNDINLLPIQSENLLKKENELPGGNNTFGFFPLRKPLSSNDLNNHSYQRLDSDTTSNDNLLLSNYYSCDRLIQNISDMNSSNNQRTFIKNRNEDDKYHNLYLTMNYLNRPTAINDMNFHPLTMPSINNGRVTTVKKLPLLDCVVNNTNKTDLVESINPNNRQKGPIINNQFNKPIMNINDGRNTFTNNINVKKLVNKENSNSNEESISNERKSNPNLISNNLLNNQINGIIHNQRINFPPNQRNKIINDELSEKKNININFNNQQLNQLLINDYEQIQLKDINYYIIGQQKKSLKPLNNIQIINSEHIDFIQNQNNFNQNDSIRQNLNPNQEVSKNINLSNNIESIRDLNTNEIDKKNQDETEEKEEEQNENIRSENQNNIQKKNNVDISYNDFDGSGWIKNYGGVSRPGKDVYGNQKVNQDSFVSLTNINNIKDFNIFGVLDGHGPEGHYVSEFASDYIPSQITNNTEIKKLDNPEKIYEKLKENNCQIITNAFLSCDEELKKVDFDVLSSGSTCVIIIHIGTHIICANVGDSRGIIVYNDDDENNDPELNDLEVAQLSMDYKPELLDEKNRILLNGGVVEKMKNEFGEEVGPFRVWAKGTDYPGLAMSRSIGDFKGKRVGVIAEPGIMEYDLCEDSKYIVICSDGVWEFINNEEVKNMGKTFYLNNDPSGFCHHIINNSVIRWEKNEIIIDDISIVTVFF